MKKLSRPGATVLALSVNYENPQTTRQDGWTDNSVFVELEVGRKEPVLIGIWDAAIRLGGKLLRPLGDWTEPVVSTEDDCDYFEIDVQLDHDYRLQRHFLLDMANRVLILADTVLWDGDGKRREKTLEYESSILYSPTLTPKKTAAATELAFVPPKATKPLFRVLPLGLPEWTDATTDAELTTKESNLVLRQKTTGQSLFAPMFFDLDAKRVGRPYTWRKLTVGENLQKVPDDKAVGWRVQLGKEQFLVYRSLTPMTSRTLLGHNLIDDFCYATFSPPEGVDAIVTVQQEIE